MGELDIQETAVYWVIEEDDPKFTQSAALEGWLADAPRHREVYLALKRTWQRALTLRYPSEHTRQ